MTAPAYTESTSWREANQHYLMQAIAQVRRALEERVNPQGEGGNERQGQHFPSAPAAAITPPSALETLCHLFNLSSFERYILLLCASVEVSNTFVPLYAAIQGDGQRIYPTFSLALATFSAPDWTALTPQAPLRHWRLLEVGAGNALATSPLRIDERILHYLLGVQYLDERLVGIVQPLSDSVVLEVALPDSHRVLVQQLARTGLQYSGLDASVMQLCGDDVSSKRAIAAAACNQLGLKLLIVAAEALPTELSQFNLVKCLCEREAALTNSVLLLDCDRVEETTASGEAVLGQLNGAIAPFIESVACPLIVTSRDRRRQQLRPLVTFNVHSPTPDEQRVIWRSILGETASSLNGQIDTLVSYFNLSPPAIRAACTRVMGQLAGEQEEQGSQDSKIQNLLWDACLTQARPRLDELAQYIEPTATWDELVLPDKERQVLRTLAAHVRQRAKVYESWGFAGKSRRGLGISALFAGASGTGKTMAAEVLARDLQLDLYRIDLSTVVSKYIGETEKNLRKVFDAAEAGGVILLFDEADALFGKRSEVKDSHDRYANMEVSYLLQRIESYRGLAILTTNLKSSLDQAFLRRIRFIVQFPFPDATQRAEIWQRIFPQQTPTKDLAFNKLAKLSVAGGNIRNIALNAAFLAAEAEESVEMKHILQAAQSEYIKLERPLTDAEVKGWV
ncbi:MAG: ATP-binding protein [Microcoleus sp. SIO2G3]|nr:ATP-binding protein [Microcoleus sp. SIO2G3]